MADRIITADGPSGQLYACVSPGAHHVQSEVADSRLLASLRPFRDDESALRALAAAGAKVPAGGAE